MVVVTAALRKRSPGAATTAPRKPRLRLVQDDEISPRRGTILRQARQFYDPQKILLLEESLETEGLYHAVEIAQLNEKAALRYLQLWNWTWGTRYKLEQISRGPDGFYEIVVAGHCRKLAGEGLLKKGSQPASWKIELLPDISPEDALKRQMQENIHSKPETWEDAEAVYRNWRLYQRLIRESQRAAKRFGTEPLPELTVKELARRVGRSESAVRDYIQFGDAPAFLQKAVRTNKVVYGKALALARAVNMGAITIDQLRDHWLSLAELPGTSVQRFEAAMLERIEAARHQQSDLFGDLTADAVAKAYENDRRAIVFPELIGRIHETTSYFAKVRELDEQGLLGESGPYSDDSPNRTFRLFIKELGNTLPRMRQLTDAQRQEAERVLAETSAHLSDLGPASEQTLQLV